MNKMLFDFNQPKDLFTPPIRFGGVDKINPLLASSDLFSLDDRDVCFSSVLSKKDEYVVEPKDNINENFDNHLQQQDDLFSTFDFPVLSEFDKTDIADDVSHLIHEAPFPSPPVDNHNSEEIDIFSIEDTTSALEWVGEECTIDSENIEDMMVPPSPSASSTSSSPSVARPKGKKKSSLSTNERKLRKKDQNKTAAEKYRLKKRVERDELISRHSELKDHNRELKFQLENSTFQLEQLKQLFVDVLQIPIPPKIN